MTQVRGPDDGCTEKKIAVAAAGNFRESGTVARTVGRGGRQNTCRKSEARHSHDHCVLTSSAASPVSRRPGSFSWRRHPRVLPASSPASGICENYCEITLAQARKHVAAHLGRRRNASDPITRTNALMT
jgi:hypothetical protein